MDRDQLSKILEQNSRLLDAAVEILKNVVSQQQSVCEIICKTMPAKRRPWARTKSYRQKSKPFEIFADDESENASSTGKKPLKTLYPPFKRKRTEIESVTSIDSKALSIGKENFPEPRRTRRRCRRAAGPHHVHTKLIPADRPEKKVEHLVTRVTQAKIPVSSIRLRSLRKTRILRPGAQFGAAPRRM
ncbi:hypothetical protein TWF481_002659 [Arthrobotrys musiformis]|uniref:Uncharacterized protein n=1 Tax=Arthrobotrys musiformis TaxID=47236 RepID=A0AAV9VST5_9PEZI